jgi:PPOX class probable F420-dependent enzyme
MASLTDPAVCALLEPAHHAVLSTLNADGSIHGTVVWFSLEDGELAVNGADARHWSANLNRDPRMMLVVLDPADPYTYVEIRGTATGTDDDAEAHVDRLARRYLGQDAFPRRPGEVRIKYVITPARVRYSSQG